MSPSHDPSGDDGRATVQELVRQREQLRGWLSRLDEVRSDAPGRVAERVRADYEDRLRRVTEELGTHRADLEADLERMRGDLREAEERGARARDALEEVRLRHLIGELDEASWDEARPDLEGDVAAAEEEAGRARDEVERLRRLLTDIAGPPPAPEPAPEPEPQPEPATPPAAEAPPAPAPEPEAEPAPPAAEEPPAPAAPVAEEPQGDPFGHEYAAPPEEEAPATAEAEGDDLPWLDSLDSLDGGADTAWTAPDASDGLDFLNEAPPAREAGTTRPAPGSDLGDDDLAFLEELDRAISGTPGGAAPAASTPTPPAPPAGTPSAAPPPGRLLCKECGAPNEPHSWYCEVCGSEL